MTPLSHFDEQGASRMVDVSAKASSVRVASAEGFVRMRPETLKLIRNREFAKGDVLEVARLAAIMATKRTSDLIPLCHPLPIDGVTVDMHLGEEEPVVRVVATVRTTARTGVEMEALTAVTVAGLTVYDMCKSMDREMSLGPFQLLEKSGGQSGHYRRDSLTT